MNPIIRYAVLASAAVAFCAPLMYSAEAAPAPRAPRPGSPASAADSNFNAAAEQKLKAQATRLEAKVHVDRGYQYLRQKEYEQARREATLAMKVDPENADAQRLLKRVDELLGKPLSDQVAIQNLESRHSVQIQSQLVKIEKAVLEARRDLSSASKVSAGVPTLEAREKMLAERLRLLNAALKNVSRAQESITWLPPEIDYADRGDIAELFNTIRGRIGATEQEVDDLRRQRILNEAKVTIAQTETEQVQRIALLMERAEALYEKEQFREVERVANLILRRDPLNDNARALRDRAAVARLKKTDHEQQYNLTFSRNEVFQDVDESRIPYTDLVTYPRVWDQILARQGKTTIAGAKSDEPWIRRIRERLKQPVTFSFEGQPFRETIDFLAALGEINIVKDPEAMDQFGDRPIDFRAEGWPLELALKWILQMAELDMDFRDNAIYISTPDKLDLEGKRLELRIYDVQDITMQTRHFIAPELILGQTERGASSPFDEVGEEVINEEILVEFIQGNIAPESWDLEGALIQESQGRIIVANKGYVHQLIHKFLSDFRNTQKILVNVEARFLQLREADFSEVGVEWTGINPLEQYVQNQALVGDFGDVTGMHIQYTQRDRTSGNSAVTVDEGNPPVPGLRTPARSIEFPAENTGNDPNQWASYAVIGSMLNSRINYANSIDAAGRTISALDNFTGQVTGSGFHGQLLFIDGLQMQAIIRAVLAKENTSLLFAPKLTVRNGQRAYVFLARQFHYVRDYEVSGTLMDPVIGYIYSGIVLDVRPIVSYDRRYITLDLRPTVTETIIARTIAMTGYVEDGAGVFYPVTVYLEMPRVDMKKVRSSVTIPDGGIVFIGGMYSDMHFKAENGFPVISDLPIIGRVFRWDVDENMRLNTAIMVSGNVIMFDDKLDVANAQ